MYVSRQAVSERRLNWEFNSGFRQSITLTTLGGRLLKRAEKGEKAHSESKGATRDLY